MKRSTKAWTIVPLAALGLWLAGCNKQEETIPEQKIEQAADLSSIAEKAKKYHEFVAGHDGHHIPNDDYENAVTAWTELRRVAEIRGNVDQQVRALYNISDLNFIVKQYDRAIDNSTEALRVIRNNRVRISGEYADLEDNLVYRRGVANSRRGNTQEMFADYFWCLLNGDDGTKIPALNELYAISTSSHKNARKYAKIALDGFSGDGQNGIRAQLIERALYEYIGEIHTSDVRGNLKRIQTLNKIYGLDSDIPLVRETTEMYLRGLGPQELGKAKERATAFRGFNSDPLIGMINTTIMQYKPN